MVEELFDFLKENIMQNFVKYKMKKVNVTIKQEVIELK